ncbi:RNA exonuclease Rex2 [Pseudovirgaria hyperparasitica]|uniref:RNA exonuclease Rex2 n=1 Tax=Pseudovirgaria hyperparasitica TaxID=470096 RepID=A0A6A6WER8_9PEZI|nr:RNA exonuclease Rex2 [Pseudovirgaria hyperparasitica]KAF2761318.1 RNA exonuclease Rex2 [Pseudovirgaria hyperparasitica]
MASREPLVWIDCEMTGLNAETESLLEIACFITDHDLNMLDSQGFQTVIHHPRSRMAQMDAWCTQHHGDSGLTERVVASTTTSEQAADALLAYIRRHVPTERTALLAGNSVHADRSFLAKAPYDRVLRYLHYRILDVSSLKEAARRWAPDEALKSMPLKKNLHEARADILESIAEARYYRDTFFAKGR